MIAVLIGVALLWTGARDDFRPDQRYATAHGEQHRWALPDGSMLELNTDSAVRVRWSGVERVVELAQGQAYFQVAKDSQRRFRVAIEGANIVAVGTQFEVYRKDRTALVTVVEGALASLMEHTSRFSR